MRLSRLQVDGFGALFDVEVELRGGLAVVLGPNEAGKSTLLHFLTGMLYGFGRKGNPAYHPPVRGGRHGGSVEIVDNAGGLWCIERHTAPARSLVVHLPGGGAAGETELRRLLGGSSLDLFSAVFAVDLDGLSQIRNVSSDEVKEVLFSSAVMGQRRSAAEVSRQLGTRQLALARPRQGEAAANRLMAELQEVRAEIAEVRRGAGGLPSLQEEIKAIQQARDDLRARELSLMEAESEFGRLKQLWERLSSGRDAADKLAELPPLDIAAKRLLECEDDVRRTVAAWSGHAARLAQIDDQRRSRDGIEDRVKAGLTSLGPGITEAQALKIRHDVSARDALRRLIDADRALRARLGDASSAARSAGEEMADAERGVAALDARALDSRPPTSRGHHSRADGSLAGNSWAGDAMALEAAGRELSELRRRIAERRELSLQIQVSEQGRRPLSVGGLSRATLALVVLGVATLGGAALAEALRQPSSVVLCALAVGLALLLAAGLSVVRRAGHGGFEPGSPSEKELLRGQVHDLDRRIGALASKLGLAARPTTSDVEIAVESVEAELHDRRKLDEALSRLDGARTRSAAAQRAVREIEQQLRDLELDFVVWKAEAGLWEDCTLETAAAALEVAAQLDKDMAARARVDSALSTLRRAVASFEGTLAQLATDLDEPMPRSPAEQDAWLQSLERRLADHRDQRLKREMLQATVSRVEAEVEEALGKGTRAESLRVKLAEGAVLEWDREQARIASELATIRSAGEDLVRKDEAAKQELGSLLASDRLADLENLQAALEQELDAVLVEYMTLGCARYLISSTLERYEEERQPEVIRRASEHFSRITDGRYRHVVLDPSDSNNPLMRVRSDSGYINATDLSKGTIEQLYLSLRLGLAEEFAERSVALPIILDDVLVNFDELRAEAVVGDLCETARRHQVILFTCHEHLAEMVLGRDPDAQLVSLERL